MITIVLSVLKSQIRNKSLAFRTFPFVVLILFIFAFAFDPDSGLIEKVSPGLFWLSILFGSHYVLKKNFNRIVTNLNQKSTLKVNQNFSHLTGLIL